MATMVEHELGPRTTVGRKRVKRTCKCGEWSKVGAADVVRRAHVEEHVLSFASDEDRRMWELISTVVKRSA